MLSLSLTRQKGTVRMPVWHDAVTATIAEEDRVDNNVQDADVRGGEYGRLVPRSGFSFLSFSNPISSVIGADCLVSHYTNCSSGLAKAPHGLLSPLVYRCPANQCEILGKFKWYHASPSGALPISVLEHRG